MAGELRFGYSLAKSGCAGDLAAIKGQHMIQPQHLAAAKTDEILTCPTEQVTDNIMQGLDLTGIIPVNNFYQPRRRQILAKQNLDFAGQWPGGAV